MREVDAPGLEALIKVGSSRPVDDTYCAHILAGTAARTHSRHVAGAVCDGDADHGGRQYPLAYQRADPASGRAGLWHVLLRRLSSQSIVECARPANHAGVRGSRGVRDQPRSRDRGSRRTQARTDRRRHRTGPVLDRLSADPGHAQPAGRRLRMPDPVFRSAEPAAQRMVRRGRRSRPRDGAGTGGHSRRPRRPGIASGAPASGDECVGGNGHEPRIRRSHERTAVRRRS